ncbi:ERVV2 protein, partial [Eolophus roseicapillus]|nr:ERVV2 protein [Eolophus roseicapilla]
LVSQGGVCSVINYSCCSYADQSRRITTDLKEIWKQFKVFHEVAQDNTSWRFEEIWKKLTSWLPNFSWLKQLYISVLMIIVVIFITGISVQCFFWCCKQSMNYEEWKRKRIKHQVEMGKYFRKT